MIRPTPTYPASEPLRLTFMSSKPSQTQRPSSPQVPCLMRRERWDESRLEPRESTWYFPLNLNNRDLPRYLPDSYYRYTAPKGERTRNSALAGHRQAMRVVQDLLIVDSGQHELISRLRDLGRQDCNMSRRSELRRQRMHHRRRVRG